MLGDSRTVTDQSRQGKTRVVTITTTQDIDQQALTAGGNLVLSAGHDVNLTAAKLDAGNGLALVAVNDLNSTTLTTVDSSTTLETRKRKDMAPRSVRQQTAEPKLSSSMLRP
ncbi:hemagglutinin repeat-containing protein [Xanthomonas campestris pv. cannae]|nr:hemagglutinin repeat-containing protein [Xanthomonas campestris pv. cannae]